MGTWITLHGKELLLNDGTICYRREDVREIVNKLMQDIGTDPFYKKIDLDDWNRNRLKEALFERFHLRCELCGKWEDDLEDINGRFRPFHLSYEEDKMFIKDVSVCQNCISKLYEAVGGFNNIKYVDGKRKILTNFVIEPMMFNEEIIKEKEMEKNQECKEHEIIN